MADNTLTTVVRALLGISAYQLPTAERVNYYPSLEDATVEQIREALGGAIQPLLTTKLRWYLQDLESAQAAADGGTLRLAAQLWRAMKRDGVLAGLIGTRAGGLLALPNAFYGDGELVDELSRKVGETSKSSETQTGNALVPRTVFDEMCPPGELEALAADGFGLGIGVAELVPVPGRRYPVLIRLDPEFLIYRWSENRWYFQSVAGLIPIVPGDGRWVLHVPGARISPWIQGLWPALGRSFINKEHAMLHRSNYSKGLANPARLAYAPQAATEAQRIGFFKRLLAWGQNTVLELPPGYEAKLLESNGRGFDVFQSEIDTSNKEFMTAICGQEVTTTGGTGFINGDLFKMIRQDLIKKDGEGMAYTINTQIIPQYIWKVHGAAAVTTRNAIIQYDTSTPKEQEAQARTLNGVSDAIAKLQKLLMGSNRELNLDEMATRFALPLRKLDDKPGKLAEVVATVDESPAGPRGDGTEMREEPQEKEAA